MNLFRARRYIITCAFILKMSRQCEVCGFVASKASYLAAHRLSHSGGTSFPCSEKNCDANFTQKVYLKVHFQLVHCAKRFPCERPGCSYVSQSKRVLHEHHNRHDGIREYGCTLCSMRFHDTAALTKHYRIHGGKPDGVLKKSSLTN